MLSKVSDFIARHQLLSRDGLHVVALSGGADSVALLQVLLSLDYRVEAAHCNFHLRGDESDRDEAFVKSLCHRLNVPLHLIHFDTAEYAALHQVSIEMAARELRYGYFRQLCQDIGASTVCVAHHRDDAVETLLMNLLRGSGIHGLTGIRPRNGLIVRPLLYVSREEILQYLHAIRQDYVTDSSNLVDDVVRNKVRLNVLPMLKAINPRAAENISKSAQYLGEAEQVYCAAIQAQKSDLVRQTSGEFPQKVSILQLLSLPSPESLLHEWLSPYGFNQTQTQQILSGLGGESGREYLSPAYTLLIDRETLVLAPLQEPMKSIRIPEEGRYRYDETTVFAVELTEDAVISRNPDSATLDADQVRFPLTIRPVQTGDAFCPLGMEGHRLVSDFLTDRKLSLYEKRRQLVVTDRDGLILWLVGLRPDHRYRVSAHTKTVISITLLKNNSL